MPVYFILRRKILLYHPHATPANSSPTNISQLRNTNIISLLLSPQIIQLILHSTNLIIHIIYSIPHSPIKSLRIFPKIPLSISHIIDRLLQLLIRLVKLTNRPQKVVSVELQKAHRGSVVGVGVVDRLPESVQHPQVDGRLGRAHGRAGQHQTAEPHADSETDECKKLCTSNFSSSVICLTIMWLFPFSIDASRKS